MTHETFAAQLVARPATTCNESPAAKLRNKTLQQRSRVSAALLVTYLICRKAPSVERRRNCWIRRPLSNDTELLRRQCRRLGAAGRYTASSRRNAWPMRLTSASKQRSDSLADCSLPLRSQSTLHWRNGKSGSPSWHTMDSWRQTWSGQPWSGLM